MAKQNAPKTPAPAAAPAPKQPATQNPQPKKK